MSIKSAQLELPVANFRVAEWGVDALANRITHKDVERKLESKVMAVLVYLVQHRDRIVSREELEKEIWGNSIVGYEALTSSIAKLRKSLDDNSRNPRFIETVSKKGYRLIAQVVITDRIEKSQNDIKSETKSSNVTAVSRKITFAASAILALISLWYGFQSSQDAATTTNAIDEKPTVVVLPFDNLSRSEQQGFISEGITRDVTTSLSKLSGVFIIAGSSARAYKGRNLDAKEIASELGVRYIVEGSVQGADSRVRVSVQLIDALSGFHLWAESYDRELGDLFKLQDDITTKLASALSIQLTEQEKQRIARRYTTSISAYDDFIQGQLNYAHHTKQDNQLAREFYNAAIQKDQSFARAYAALALTYSDDYRFKWSDNPSLALAEAKRMVTIAIDIDKLLPQAYWVSSLLHMHMQQYETGIALAKRAIELDPNYADSYAALAMSSIYNDQADIAIENIRIAMRLNPVYPSHYASALGQAYYYKHRYEEALPVLRDAVQRNLNLQTSYIYLIVTLVQLQQLEEANWMAAQLRNLEPTFTAAQVEKMFPIKDRQRVADMVKQLRTAGL